MVLASWRLYREGRLDLEHLRGRSTLPASAQVAEIALRRRLGLDGIRDIELVEADEGMEDASATFQTADGRTHRLGLRPLRLGPPRAISCAARRAGAAAALARGRAVSRALFVEAAERWGTPLYVTDLDPPRSGHVPG